LNTADDDDPPIMPEPLTRRNRAGQPYLRDSDVELQILTSLPLSREDLRRRTAISDRGSPDYLKEECLVYLVRHYHRGGDEQRVRDLSSALLDRTTSIIRKRIRSLGPDALDEGYSQIVTRLFSKILDISTNQADFFQVRFWCGMNRICIQVFGIQLADLERRRMQVSFSDIPGYEPNDDEAEPEMKSVRLSEEDKQKVSSPSGEKAIVDPDLAREARRIVLTHLDEPFRSVYMLRHYHGWAIEDRNPNVPTISRHFGKTPRTIRNWLDKAAEVLASRRGGQT